MGRIADPVGDAIRAKEAAKAEADHLAAVRALPTPKELKAMEKKKAEDEWFVAASFLFLPAVSVVFDYLSRRPHNPASSTPSPRCE
jgi:hypothetical protein